MLTNTQLYLAIGFPTLAVISSLIVSLVQVSGIRGELSEFRTDMREIRSEIRDLRVELRGTRDEIADVRVDLKLLTGKVYELMGQRS